jgi:hypothetical protein
VVLKLRTQKAELRTKPRSGDERCGAKVVKLTGIIERYKQLTGGAWGRLAALQEFGLTREEAEQAFSALDEDYHISRYFHFSDERKSAAEAAFSVNGFPQTHVSLDKEIEELL